jgi:hypothetical protein
MVLIMDDLCVRQSEMNREESIKIVIGAMDSSRLRYLFILLFFCLVLGNTAHGEVDFDHLNGADLGMGIGARAISMGGAFTAICDDVSAVFWNPAGLTQLEDNQTFLSGDYPEEFSSAGIAYQPRLHTFKEYHLTFGVSIVNRLSFYGDSGEEVWDGYTTHLLHLAMVDSSDDFSGKIRSKTMDIRFSLALAPLKNNRFHLGVNFKHIH